mgnify:CR=1 FL=1
MDKIFKVFVFTFLIFGIFSCQKEVKGPENTPGEEKLAQLDKKISDIAKELNLEAYSYAVVSNAEMLNLAQNGINPDEKIEVGDLKNMFLSTLFLQCAEEKLANPSDYLNNYGVAGDKGKVRIKNVLSFTDQPSEKPVHYDNENYLLIYPILQQVSEEEVSDLFESNICRSLKMPQSTITKEGDVIHCYSSLDDLVNFSMAIDNQRLFEEEDTHEEMFRPVYLESGERSPSGLGCFIDISDERKIIWSAGHTNEYSSLLIKSETDSLSFIMVAKSERLNAPFQLENGEIGKTPFYYAFMQSILRPDSLSVNIDFYGDSESIKNSIQEAIEKGNRDEVYDELTSYMKLSAFMKNGVQFEKLSQVYQEVFPKDIQPKFLLDEPLAKIKANTNYLNYQRTFSLGKDDTVTLFSTCEFTKTMTLQPWEYDDIEMYFDMNHEKLPSFRSSEDDRQYRFDYDFPDITGNAPTFEGINFAQYDQSPTRYNFEIAFPWKVLFNNDTTKPKLNQKIGFDMATSDNDGQAREGALAWNSIMDQTPWSNTSFLGTLILASSQVQTDDSICLSMVTQGTIQIDGQNKGEWDNVPRYSIAHEFMTGITGPEDQSSWFRTQWDENNLYFFVEIEDDIKREIEKSADFGWLVRNEQDTVWMQKEDETLHAGGAPSNKYILTQVPLTAGNYTLHYQTNNSHTYGLWDKERPELSFYGIVVY